MTTDLGGWVRDLGPVHYLPILTTAICAIFLVVLVRAYQSRRSGPHLAWWAAGVFTYGLGTFLESVITLQGNTVLLNKSWYVAGAILGGYPLAQGAVFLLCKRETALRLTWITLPFLFAASALVFLSPVNVELMESFRPSGKVLEWRWVRLMTPFINLYSAFFLIGGAAWSAMRYVRLPDLRYRATGNALISVGALLPGIGGTMAKGGLVEALYIGECVGIVLIWAGYGVIASRNRQRAAEPLAASPATERELAAL